MPIALLTNRIQPYAWGSNSVIATLQNRPSPSSGPEAELWMGAHPNAPSQANLSGSAVGLDSLIAQDPRAWLGPRATEFEARLPFLLKVLAAETPLSLQAHPNPEQARLGYAEDEARGISKKDPRRRYQDASHKPELLCALTSFQALCGFRDPRATLALFEPLAIPALREPLSELALTPSASGLRRLLSILLQATSEERLALVQQTVRACEQLLPGEHEFSENYAWSLRLSELYPGDVGIVSQLLLNLVELEPGEAMYLPAGNLHAYLNGAGIEIMASSDNVLRAGLTPKPVHPEELLKILDFSPLSVAPLQGRSVSPEERVYETPAKEFELSRLELRSGRTSVRARSAEIWLCVEGSVALSSAQQTQPLIQGQSAVVSADTSELTLTGSGLLFRAAVGRGP